MYSVSHITVGQKGTERTPTSLVHGYLLLAVRTAMVAMVFRPARCVPEQTAEQLTTPGGARSAWAQCEDRRTACAGNHTKCRPDSPDGPDGGSKGRS